jgi:hypothetical protein
MTAQASAQVDTRQRLRSVPNAREATGSMPPGAGPWRSLEIDGLHKRWLAVANPQHSLPPFEKLPLTSPEGLAENVALLQIDGTGALTIAEGGKAHEAWIGRPAHSLKVSGLSIERARSLRELHDQAAEEGRPAQTVAYGVVDDLVCVYDLVALPLSSRRGASPCLFYIQERERNFSPVEAMFLESASSPWAVSSP